MAKYSVTTIEYRMVTLESRYEVDIPDSDLDTGSEIESLIEEALEEGQYELMWQEEVDSYTDDLIIEDIEELDN